MPDRIETPSGLLLLDILLRITHMWFPGRWEVCLVLSLQAMRFNERFDGTVLVVDSSGKQGTSESEHGTSDFRVEVRTPERLELEELETMLTTSGLAFRQPAIEGFTDNEYATWPEVHVFVRVADPADLARCEETWQITVTGHEIYGRDARAFKNLLKMLMTMGGASISERWEVLLK